MRNKGRRSDYAQPGDQKRRETTRDERLQVVTLRDKAGMTWKKIAEKVNIDFRTCQKIYQRTMLYGTPSNQHRVGRPVFFGDAEKQRLVEFVTRDPRTRRLQWEEVIVEMGYQCSVRTIRDVLADGVSGQKISLYGSNGARTGFIGRKKSGCALFGQMNLHFLPLASAIDLGY
ncbi:hypothetical protein HOY80DRAFT_1064103 [Tuber brumale]|nr:hypothetical protein HOY80DRAFT_1064103 [Tuber brumale]